MRILACADIHGNQEVYRWLAAVSARHSVEQVVLAGDLFGFPEEFPMEAFPTIRSYSPAAADLLWKKLQDLGPRLVTERIPLPYELFFDGLPTAHLDFFRSLPAFLRTPECVCVHGGVDPLGGPVEGQEDGTLIWGCAGFPEAYRGADAVVYGHADDPVVDDSGRPQPRIVGRTYGIDTISRGVLSAIRFPELKVFQSRRHE